MSAHAIDGDSEIRKCGGCGGDVTWVYRTFRGWRPNYHDCNVVLREQAERERDEARDMRERLLQRAQDDKFALERLGREVAQAKDRLGQAVALLREVTGRDNPTGDIESRIAAFLDGNPAPVARVVDDAMVERLCRSVHGDSWALNLWPDDAQRTRNSMRAALVAALEGKL